MSILRFVLPALLVAPLHPSPPERDVTTVPSGTRARAVLVDWLGSRGTDVGAEPLFCLDEDVHAGTSTLLNRGMPVVGIVDRVSTGGAGFDPGDIAVRLKVLLTPDGGRISVSGSGSFVGGSNAASAVWGGLMALGTRGDDVKLPPGTAIEFETAAEASWSREAEVDGPEWRRCRDFLQFAQLPALPLSELETAKTYRWPGNELVGDLDVADLEEGSQTPVQLRGVVIYDAFLLNTKFGLTLSKKKAAFDLSTIIQVLESHDKRVDMRVSLLDGDEVLATVLKKGIDAEEEKVKKVDLRLRTERELYERAVNSGGGRLRLEMKVRE